MTARRPEVKSQQPERKPEVPCPPRRSQNRKPAPPRGTARRTIARNPAGLGFDRLSGPDRLSDFCDSRPIARVICTGQRCADRARGGHACRIREHFCGLWVRLVFAAKETARMRKTQSIGLRRTPALSMALAPRMLTGIGGSPATKWGV
jgi:hypothetical protein